MCWIIGGGIVFWMVIFFFCLALCNASSEADKHAERQYLEYIKSKDKENINQKEQGE